MGRRSGEGEHDGWLWPVLCLVAKAMELLDERWTMLVVRELLNGSYTIALRRGVPCMSPALLSTRPGRWPAPG